MKYLKFNERICIEYWLLKYYMWGVFNLSLEGRMVERFFYLGEGLEIEVNY